MKVVGYLDRVSFRAGDEVQCMVSAETGPVTVDLVRLVHGDTSPAGPGFRSETVSDVGPQEVPARVQRTHVGSCMLALDAVPADTSTVRLSVMAWPTRPVGGAVQGLVSLVAADGRPVAAVAVDGAGRVHVRLADGETRCQVSRPLLERRWYRINAVLGAAGCELSVSPLREIPEDSGLTRAADARPVVLEGGADVVVAALAAPLDGRRPCPEGVFNGKLERPLLKSDDGVLAEWAFERESSGSRVVDVSGRRRHATFVNMPARAMTGHSWTGDVVDFREAPDQYGAVHFHDDDLSDAGWDVTARLRLPAGLRSGVYAVRLRVRDPGGEAVDHVPLVVLPPLDGPRARVAYLLPTFTYAAYANVQPMAHHDAGRLHPLDVDLRQHPEFGKSLYDLHSDGSGVCYSSLSRPVLNLRPDYRSWLTRAPRYLGADLYLVDWMEHAGIEYDVLTDHDLHVSGDALLRGYQVVATGSHPEYWSARMLGALHHHIDDGGCLMYLGGNGFYWVTSQDQHYPHSIEVRRTAGTRTWEGEPGELQHSTTGEVGGLWRWRGRSPNVLTGVGMAAQGWDASVGYRRTPESFDSRWEWVFAGVDDEVIGNFGLVMGGASGDELDRHDARWGSPPQTAVLATSVGHSAEYYKVVEDVLAVAGDLSGQASADVRSDLVIVEQAAGGAVFSVGSIAFMGSLSWNGYDNNVSRVVRNVMENFLGRRAP